MCVYYAGVCAHMHSIMYASMFERVSGMCFLANICIKWGIYLAGRLPLLPLLYYCCCYIGYMTG